MSSPTPTTTTPTTKNNTSSDTIPNVSCVFRDLPRLNSNREQQQNYLNMNYYNKNNINNYNKKIQFDYNQRVDLISKMGVDDRQQRHEQLMNRFKCSLNENRLLLGINQPQYQRVNNNESQNRNTTNQPYSLTQQPYYPNQLQQYHYSISHQFQKQQQSAQKKWSIPKIKYRHIEDFQQKKNQSNNSAININDTNNNNNKLLNNMNREQINKSQQQPLADISHNNQTQKTTNLQRQFYQNNSNNQKQEQQLVNKYSRFANNLLEQQSKYNQNLQSYYQLCRKPLRSALHKQDQVKQTTKSTTNEQKFLRKPSSKVGGINLSKAIQILSLD